MVRTTDESYIVEVQVASKPAEDYVETITDLVNLLQSESDDSRANHFYLLELLKAMLPTIEQAQVMLQKN